MKKKKFLAPLISFGAASVVFVGATLGVTLSGVSPVITAFLCGTGENFSQEGVSEALAESDLLCSKIAEDSITLLKNKDQALPLAKSTNKINIFGYGATDTGFLLRGVGSGSSTISNLKKVTLLQAFTDAGIEVNSDVMQIYEDFAKKGAGRPSSPAAGNIYRLAEPEISSFDGIWDSAKEFSDTAIFVLSRDGGENVGEIPTTMGMGSEKTYLDITDQEEEMLNALGEKFSKVIVLLNTTNTMHVGFLNSDKIDAVLYVGITGQSGARAIPDVLLGKVNPSGKLADVMTYVDDYDPTFVNHEAISDSICYQEDIYYGYKWYETADAENYFDKVDNVYGKKYDGVVQYPFGYGLSYSNFSWKLKSVSLPAASLLSKDSTITMKVEVTNESEVPGKDVVQLYYTPPYTKGGVEKAEVNLLTFAKTLTIPAHGTQEVELSFSAYDLASYDCYDKNQNGKSTYELDVGTYRISLRNDAHHVADMENAVTEYSVESILSFDEDPVSGQPIQNRFTGEDAYLDMPTDGSKADIGVTYLSRADFAGTFPTKRAKSPSANAIKAAAESLYDTPYADCETVPASGIDYGYSLVTKEDGSRPSGSELSSNSGNGLIFNEELLEDLADYDSETWDKVLGQMSHDDLKKLVELGGFRTSAIDSIGKPIFNDYDGPAGFNTNSRTGNWSGDSIDTESWTAYPSEALMGCSWNSNLMFELGFSMGKEANLTSLNGWYAPGVNLHRSAYNARNYEYYSEDGVLSGKLAAQVIRGAKANGLYCYLKHFACSEEGPNPREVNTWITEQNLRENYLRPFEIAVKEGSANAMMSAFNRIGATWCGANYALLNGVLRGEWGFKGSVITDWTDGGNGVGGMNTRQGVRAGNDLWLNPYDTCSQGLQKSNKIDMYCARVAAKNILYTFVDTWYFNKYFDDSELDGLNKVDMVVSFKDDVVEWWKFVLWGIDGALVATTAVFATLFILKNKKKKEESEAQD